MEGSVCSVFLSKETTVS